MQLSLLVLVGLAAIYLLRRWPRAAFAAAIATTIYSSPVVLPGNLALFLAVAAPWELSADRTVGVRGLSVAIRRRVVNIEKARRMLRWTPRTTLEAGMRATAEWFHEAGFEGQPAAQVVAAAGEVTH
jgi:hypothetical protein